jgi:hypothetical protein
MPDCRHAVMMREFREGTDASRLCETAKPRYSILTTTPVKLAPVAG